MEMREVNERAKLQFDYAWKWFESHQRQHTVMFYYYCIIVGILANALVALYNKGNYFELRIPIGIMGIITSLAFFFFDIRNRGMAKVGEDILEKLENDIIFPPEFVDNKGNKMGPLTVDRRIGMREGQKLTLK